MRAYLLTSNPSYKDTDATVISNSVEMSYLYLDKNKEARATSKQEKNKVAPMYAIFDKTQLKAGNTYYIFLLPFNSDSHTNPTYDNTWLQAINRAADCNLELIYESYSAVGQPSRPEVTSQIKKDGSVVITWGAATSGTNNPVSKYKIYYNINSQPNASTKNTKETSGTSLTISNSEIGAIKGNRIYFAIQTIGSVNGFDSTIVQIGSTLVVNSPPSWPTFDIEGVILASQAYSTITIKNLRSGSGVADIDNDTITYYYRISDKTEESQPTSISDNLTPIVNDQTVQMSEKNKYIFICAYDGEALSGFGRKTVTVAVAPVITAINATGENILNNNRQSCTRYISASAQVDKEMASYTWYIWDEVALAYSKLGTEMNLNRASIEAIGYSNKQISLKLVVLDAYGQEASLVQSFNIYQMPKIKTPKELRVSSAETPRGSVLSRYINKKISATLTLKDIEGGDIPFKKVEFYCTDANSRKKIVESQVVGGNYVFSYNFEYDLTYNFSVVIIDNADRQAELVLEDNFQRLPLINLSQSRSSVSLKNWHVLHNPSFAVSTFFPSQTGVGVNTYEFLASINNGSYVSLFEFDQYSTGSIVSGNSIIFTKENSFEIFKKLGVKTDEEDYRVDYRIIAKNAFGEFGGADFYSHIQNHTIITREAPFFTISNFFARVGYIEDAQSKDRPIFPNYSQSSYPFPQDSTLEQDLMFNSGEVICFGLSGLAGDLNSLYFDGKVESTIDPELNYEIEYVIGKEETTPASRADWQYLCTLKNKDWAEEVNPSYYYQNVIAPNLSSTKDFVYFRIFAIDKTKKKAGPIYVNYPLICCRKVVPSFTIGTISTKVQDNKTNIIIPFEIEDYGGNEKGYENFFRNGTETITMTVMAGNSPTNLAILREFTCLTNNVPKELQILTDKISGKIFFQISIKIATNTFDNDYNIIATTAPIYVYYTEGPTVSYRSHWVGINNTDCKNDEVMRVESFVKDGGKNRHMIRLVGFDLSEQTQIEIDLNSGTISGLVINGGTWS